MITYFTPKWFTLHYMSNKVQLNPSWRNGGRTFLNCPRTGDGGHRTATADGVLHSKVNWEKVRFVWWDKIMVIHICQSIRELQLGRRFLFQQDNDPKHEVNATKKWFKNKLNVLDWVSQSPAVNPRAVHAWSQSNLTEHELLCRKRWRKNCLDSTSPNYIDLKKQQMQQRCKSLLCIAIVQSHKGFDINITYFFFWSNYRVLQLLITNNSLCKAVPNISVSQ